jgi:hypothetical protein
MKGILTLASSTLVVLVSAGPPAGAQHQHPQPLGHGHEREKAPPREQEMKVGKADDVTFKREVRIGDVTFQPGQYRLQHRAEGTDHFVRFEALATTTPSAQKLGTGMAVPAGTAGEVKCRVEPLAARAKDTTLHLLNEDAGQRLTKVLIRGENVAHVF